MHQQTRRPQGRWRAPCWAAGVGARRLPAASGPLQPRASLHGLHAAAAFVFTSCIAWSVQQCARMPACHSHIPQPYFSSTALPRPVNSLPAATLPSLLWMKGSERPPASSAAAAEASCGLVSSIPMRASGACTRHACPRQACALTGAYHLPRLRLRPGGHRRPRSRARAAPAAADPASSLARVAHLHRAEWYQRRLSVYIRHIPAAT
jgi:hypothetical protein